MDLDPELSLPDGILTEQLLINAGISEDHRLLIRTTIHGEMTWDRVCEELVAQHSRIHEKETKGYYKGYSSKSTAFKGYGKNYNVKGKGWRFYYVNDEHDIDQWENASQSLGGFEDLTDDAAAYNMEHYEDYDYGEDEAEHTMAAFQAMIDERTLRRQSMRLIFFKPKQKSIMPDFELVRPATVASGPKAMEGNSKFMEASALKRRSNGSKP